MRVLTVKPPDNKRLVVFSALLCSAHLFLLPFVCLCKQSALEYIGMAALSKLFAVATTYPYQVVRARLQDQHNKYNGVIDVIRRTWRYDTDLLTTRPSHCKSACCVHFCLLFIIITSSAGMKVPLVSTKASSPTWSASPLPAASPLWFTRMCLASFSGKNKVVSKSMKRTAGQNCELTPTCWCHVETQRGQRWTEAGLRGQWNVLKREAFTRS